MKFIKKKIIPITTGLFLLAVAVFLLGNHLLSAPAPGSNKKIVVNVPRGASSYEIAYLLEDCGLIKYKKAFVYYSRLTGKDNQLKPGKYELSPACNIPELVDLLTAGARNLVAFTVPEGYTIKEITQLLEEKGLIDKNEFQHLLAEGEFSFTFLEGLPAGPARLEGYLFPDTYYIGRHTSEKKIIEIMLRRFEQEIKELNFSGKVAAKGLTLHEALTIASMVEKEAKHDRERPLIAGVIFNRLELGMPLQIDATVQYALGRHRSRLYHKDLEVDSPYNTYQIVGLPPGPICSPGRKSLEAVLHPDETDYLYYVAKPDGTHAFATTYREHIANINKYQK